MRPVLFELGPLELRSYGVFVALAFVGAWLVLRSELERRACRGHDAAALILAAAFGGLAGARLYWFAEHASAGASDGLLSGAGFTWYGGVLGGAAAVLVVARLKRLNPSVLLGAAAPALALGYGLGRIACQFAGDGTYGGPSHLPWAMGYPEGEVPTTERVHPTPVYETLASLLIFTLLWRLRGRMSGPALFGLYLVTAGVERFLVEFVRLNDAVVFGLTQPQLFAVGLACVGTLVLAGTTVRRGELGFKRPA